MALKNRWVLITGASSGLGGEQDLSWSKFAALYALNVTSTARLAHVFARYLIDNSREMDGAILLVTSLAGLVPTPYQSAYSVSKAFLTHLGQCLSEEFRRHPISVTTFAPGGIDGMVHGQILVVPGLLNRVELLATRGLPRSWIGAALARIYGTR